MKLAEAIQIIGRFTNTAVISPGETFFGQLTDGFSGRLNVEIDEEVGFYDEIVNFQKILSLFEEPEIQIEQGRINLSQGTSKAAFLTSDISLIKANSHDIKDQIEKSENAPVVLKVNFTDELVNQIKVASQTIENSRVLIISKDGKTYVTIKDIDMLSSDSNSYTIDVTEVVNLNEKEFQVELDAINFRRIPKGSFELKMLYNSRLDDYRVLIHQDLGEDKLTLVFPANKYEG